MNNHATSGAARWPRWATEPVEIVEHDPNWDEQAERERDQLHDLLSPWLVGHIEHIGSTAVAGLAAKPIIDLQAPVQALAAAETIADVLAPHSWHYVPPEFDQRPDRRFFVKVVDGHRAAHLHLLLDGTTRWREQLAFRDALRADPDLITAYAELKTELARLHHTDREAYTAAKQQFVQDVLTRLR